MLICDIYNIVILIESQYNMNWHLGVAISYQMALERIRVIVQNGPLQKRVTLEQHMHALGTF